MNRLLPIAIALGLAAGGSAHAQMIVHDPTNYASLIRQAQTALDQLNELRAQISEARRLFDGFNVASGVNDIATVLARPELRAVLPDTAAWSAAAGGDFSRLGEIGRAAGALRDANRLFTAAADDEAGQALERAGDRMARDLALARAVAEAGGRRLDGLQSLTQALDAAPNVRAVIDLQARLEAEQAMTANDQMRLQGLAMAQAAEARLAEQRQRERAAAVAHARLDTFRRGFR